MAIYKVGVVGGGVMGRGIASLIAYKGNLPVVIKELNKELAEKSIVEMNRSFDKLAAKGKPGAENCKNLVSTTDDWKDFYNVDLVIEAVVENIDVKRKVFGEAFLWLHDNAVMVSNTSALSISEMAEAVTPEARSRIAGLHFFNPPHQLKLVELIRAKETSDETLKTLNEFAVNDLGRTVIKVKECPGFLVNRLLAPYLNEAVYLFMETTLTPAEIDEQARAYWPMGPFMLMDMLGINICAEVAKVMYQGYGERMKPAPLTEKLLELNRVSKTGFYDDKPITQVMENFFPFSRQQRLSAEKGFRKMMLVFVNEAFLCLEEGIASVDDIEIGCREGLGFSPVIKGPLHWAKNMGLQSVLSSLLDYQKTNGPRFAPSQLLFECASGKKELVFAADSEEF